MTRKIFKWTGISAVALILVIVVTIIVTGHSTSSKTVHGTFTPTSETLSLFGGVSEYALCSEAVPAPGSQVTVTDPSGKVIGTGTLGPWSHQTVEVSGLTFYPCEMPFTVTGLPSESRYGFSVNGVNGTIWETDLSNVNLNVSGK